MAVVKDASKVWRLGLGDGLVGSGKIQRSHRQKLAGESLLLVGNINQDLAEATLGRSGKGRNTTNKAEQHGPSRRASKIREDQAEITS